MCHNASRRRCSSRPQSLVDGAVRINIGREITPMRRAAIFTRVSTDRQTTENQLQRLREVAERAGWHLVDVYEEVVSGAAARGQRAAYDRMLKDATRRFEVLLAWDVSRLGR